MLFQLTPEQEALVAERDGAFLVVAPPGSGKTEIVARRVVRLISDSPNDDFKVLALTFTKNAAAAMRDRIAERLGDYTWRVTVANYHSFCADILEHYGHLIGVPSGATVYESAGDRIQALLQALGDEALITQSDQIPRGDLSEMLDLIGRAKRDLIPPSAVQARLIGQQRINLRDAYSAYDAILEKNGALDFDSILYKAYELLTTQDTVARHYRLIYRYILIDEAQDTSRAQYQILKALCGSEHRNVLMVADPSQSIYAFSGASAEYSEQFVTDFGASRRTLGWSFRCAPRIFSAAQLLLPEESRTLVNSSGHMFGCIEYAASANESEEAAAVVNWAEALLAVGLPQECCPPSEIGAVSPEDIAILARSRFQLQHLLGTLDDRGHEYHFAAGEGGLFDSDEYKVVLYGLKVLANPIDIAIAKSLVASLPTLKVDDSGLDAVADKGHGSTLLFEIASRLELNVLQNSFQVMALAAQGKVELGDTVTTLLTWESDGDGADVDVLDLRESDRQLFASRWQTYSVMTPPDQYSWKGLVFELTSKPKPQMPGFRVLTAHASKGLEFRAVAVIGMNEGSFPDFRNDSDDALRSEQRLAYVAVTRAARLLRMSRPHVRATRYGSRAQVRSRFLTLMGFSD